ncbi:MAG: transketolase [Trueperaceae bacterium]|mgnify:CR=1 FL=1|nr:transketolase [Trueperaceae bacterium]
MRLESQVHERNLVRWAADRPEVVVFSADLTSSTEARLFQETYPERFYSFGMTEQNMVGVAGGMAREGYTPFLHTFAVFLYRRALDQIQMNVAYPNLPVRIFGFLPGVTTPGGATHQAIDDIAIMRALPNMTVLETGDAADVESVLDVAQAVPGPVYVRMLRGQIPRLFTDPMRLGRPRTLSEGTDVTLLTAGITTEEAMRASQALAAKGVSLEHLHVTTHKPFDAAAVLPSLTKPRYGVITFENHSVIGGLGTEVAEVMAEHGVGVPLLRLGIPDTYVHGGSKPYLMRYYGLDAAALVRGVERLLGRSLGIEEEDLAAVRVEPVHDKFRAEAL